jgi:hypothetical protein
MPGVARSTTESPRNLLASFVMLSALAAPQVGRDVGCADSNQCRQMALVAADGREFERFHDLAWRAVQLGPPNDPVLMSLLARAQALSGRPHDALVMLERLAGMGVEVDAEAGDDFAAMRQLSGWPQVRDRIDGVRRSAAPAAPVAPPATEAPAPSSLPPPSPPPAASPSAPPLREAVRFPIGALSPRGFAYDAVSSRFLFGDRAGRKLVVVAERSNRATDFVRADSAGFQEIAALEIDEKRGQLWVASTAPADGSGTLHKLQLVSGRPLQSFRVPAALEPVTLVDLAVAPSGAVFLLDAAGAQLLVLRPGAAALERIIRLEAAEPVSLSVDGDERVAYVAHARGVSRIDLRARSAAPLTAPSSISIDGLERLRWRGHGLIAIQAAADQSRRIVRFDLNASGRAVTQATTLQPPAATARPIFMTFSGDDLVYLSDGTSGEGGGGSADPSRATELVAYRLRLR